MGVGLYEFVRTFRCIYIKDGQSFEKPIRKNLWNPKGFGKIIHRITL